MTITPPDPDQAPDHDPDDPDGEEPETPETAADEGEAVEPPD
jgi:hypothetical protein